MNIKKTADLAINFAINRLAEILGGIIFISGIMLLIALMSYSPEDPNFIFPDNTEIKNFLGFRGSFISDLFFQSIGLISYVVSLTLIITGINIFRSKEFFFNNRKCFFYNSLLYIWNNIFNTFLFKCIYSLY